MSYLDTGFIDGRIVIASSERDVEQADLGNSKASWGQEGRQLANMLRTRAPANIIQHWWPMCLLIDHAYGVLVLTKTM